ncbi:DUF2589 domain-containing protein [Vibrio bivalvicida]|uniref:DUF2589 domain-containing protein n=1 Tax=Vibrio bivalvicida TaxID=1276888 RepID=A0A177XX89_9VIBR|nr:DUF2589 domain-containing protein [Vibrio bivalvicida]OAJ93214.1 hypothetical protein APB76_14715 [Vibrio bivalvicida]
MQGKKQVTLQALVEAILGSASEAQKQIDSAQVASFQQWFNQDGTPKQLEVRIPDLDNPSDKEEVKYKTVSIPTITLFQPSPLKIKHMNTKFEIGLDDLVEVTPVENHSKTHSMVIEAEKHILASLYNDHSSRMASVEVEFENGEPSEGYLRLMNELYKLI